MRTAVEIGVLLLIAAPIIVGLLTAIRLFRDQRFRRPFFSLAILFALIPFSVVTLIIAIQYLPRERPTGFQAMLFTTLALLAVPTCVAGIDLLNVWGRRPPSD